ncbi:PEP-utilizing enzyme [Paenibacillus eucommiae]|uniref:Phosphohistidine swiveling domain-containing protein n=1 Tax=Paenibacillus eucommiae TaxID=1355755 RepID=A0ABS4IPM6_9BACL|nr:PEP-utilizing enzyme [Paenibacillus eucommiae]MBP1989513.1 phosphohistidine swiveling domain-containing protein [Paenibacillus eucommiae]
MVIFNRVRIWYQKEIELLKPLVRDVYKKIHRYQLERTSLFELQMREAIAQTTPVLEVFIEHIPAYKSSYIKVLGRQEQLTSSELIMCFDRAMYELHLYAALGKSIGKYANEAPWSKELRALLNERQEIEPADSNVSVEELFLASGKVACPGHAEGRAAVIVRKDELGNVKQGDILVTTMTTPDFIEVAELIAGLVTDRGGIVCHAAILAREFNITCIVGCGNATEAVINGQKIRIDAISGIVMGCDNE